MNFDDKKMQKAGNKINKLIKQEIKYNVDVYPTIKYLDDIYLPNKGQYDQNNLNRYYVALLTYDLKAYIYDDKKYYKVTPCLFPYTNTKDEAQSTFVLDIKHEPYNFGDYNNSIYALYICTCETKEQANEVYKYLCMYLNDLDNKFKIPNTFIESNWYMVNGKDYMNWEIYDLPKYKKLENQYTF